MGMASLKESEKDFLSWIIALAHVRGFSVAHFRPALTAKGYRTAVQGDGVGFPDLVLIHPNKGMVVAEVKGPGGHLSGEQADWLGLFLLASVEAWCWWPEDRPLIERILR